MIKLLLKKRKLLVIIIIILLFTLSVIIKENKKKEDSHLSKITVQIESGEIEEGIIIRPSSLDDLSQIEVGPVYNEDYIVIASVVCEDRIVELLLMIKSAIIFSRVSIRFIIFADDASSELLKLSFRNINKKGNPNHHELIIHPIQFPTDSAIEWKKIFKPCACQRLFFPVSFILLH